MATSVPSASSVAVPDAIIRPPIPHTHLIQADRQEGAGYADDVSPDGSKVDGPGRAFWVVWALSIVGLALAADGGGPAAIVAGSVLVILATLPLLLRLRVDRLDAPGLYGLATAIFFGGVSLLWIGNPMYPPPGVERADVAQALRLVAFGALAFAVGARLMGGPRPRALLRMPPGVVSPRVLVGFLIVSTVITVAGFAVGASGYQVDAGARSSRILAVSQLVSQFATIGSVVVLAAAMRAFGSQAPRARRLLAVVVAVQVVIGFIAGFKGMSVLPVLLTGLAYVTCTGRLPVRALAITGAFTIFVLIPANYVYRVNLRNDPAFPDPTVTSVLFDSTAYVGSRFRHIDHVALIDARTPEMFAYGSGNRYLHLPALVLVPRAVWTEKPILDDGQEFSHSYWEIPNDQRTSTPLTQPGDLLRNFGVAGIGVGLLAWGLVVGGFGALLSRIRSPRAEAVYLLGLVVWVVNLETDIPQLVAGAAKTMLVATVAAGLLLPGRGGRPGYLQIRDVLRRRARRSGTLDSQMRGATPRV